MLVTGGVSWAEIALTTIAADDAVVIDQVGANLVDVLANDDAAVGGILSITDATQGANGTVVIATDGLSLTYEPVPDFCGEDSFTYTISDGLGGTDTAIVSVDVTCPELVEVHHHDDEATTTTLSRRRDDHHHRSRSQPPPRPLPSPPPRPPFRRLPNSTSRPPPT